MKWIIRSKERVNNRVLYYGHIGSHSRWISIAIGLYRDPSLKIATLL
jgi:hypothetical protein